MISLGLGLTDIGFRRRSRVTDIVFDLSTGVLPAGLVLARASAASYLSQATTIVTVPANVARFETDPISGQRGLLLGAQATNLIDYTTISPGNWSASSATLATLSLNALGVFAGCSVASTGANWHRVHRNFTMGVGTPHVLRLFVRPGSSGRLLVQFKNNTTGKLSTVTGAFGALSVGTTAFGATSVLNDYLLGDGLTRVVDVGVTSADAGSVNIGFGPDSAVAGQTVIALGCQLEAGSVASSFIATEGATVTRAADQLATSALAGAHRITADYADGSQSVLEPVTVTPGVALGLPRGRLSQLTFTPL